MKRPFLLLTFLLVNIFAFGQDNLYETKLPLNDDGIIEFTEVVQAEGKSKNELYSQAREWFVDTYKSADDVLQMEDKEDGKLIGKAISSERVKIPEIMYGAFYVYLEYTIKIYFKDGRYKYIITNFRYDDKVNKNDTSINKAPAEEYVLDDVLYKSNGKVKKNSKAYKEGLLIAKETVIRNLKAAMAKKIDSSSDDW